MNEELMPFTDPQAAVPRGFCRRCGREVYGEAEGCVYCVRWLP